MVEQVLSRDAALVQQHLDKLLPASQVQPARVLEAARYSLLGGGKRLRPALLLEFHRACGGEEQLTLPFACALEMIHTYSLIHDDLPCMDNDDLRRGRPTCHKAYGEWTAVLAGDALLNRAYEVMADAATRHPQPGHALRAMSHIARCAGLSGMVGGQDLDLQMEEGRLGADVLPQMVRMKTAALLSAACVGGCLLAGADEQRCRAAAAYADNVGIAFQIADDILDEEGSAEKLGKTTGKDAKEGKITYLSTYGADACRRQIDALTQEAVRQLACFDNSDFLRELALWLTRRDH